MANAPKGAKAWGRSWHPWRRHRAGGLSDGRKGNAHMLLWQGWAPQGRADGVKLTAGADGYALKLSAGVATVTLVKGK